MNTKFGNSRKFRNSNISDTSSTSSRQVKLRTIMKGRGSQQGKFQNYQNKKIQSRNQSRSSRNQLLASRNDSRMSQRNNGRLSVSLNLNSFSRLDQNKLQSNTVIRNKIRDNQAQNCEQQLLGKQDFDYLYKIMFNKLEDLDQAAQFLIKKKIHKMARKTTLLTLKDKGKDQISIQIQNLIQKIRNLKLQQLQKYGMNKHNKQQVRQLTDKKIKILQKLLAETSTQSQVLKNYFFAISALSSQQKSNIRGNSSIIEKFGRQKLGPLVKRNQRSKTQAKQQFFHQSQNQLTYNAPKLHQYQTYRYKNKDYKANLQPLPRSSYKSQFIVYNPKYVSPNLKNLDNHTSSFGNTRLKSSTYGKDYQLVKAQNINYKQLDGYRNKYKNLQINFNTQNRRQLSAQQFQTNKSFIIQQRRLKQIKQVVQICHNNPQRSKKIALNTQAKSQFKGQRPQIMSNIKNKRLQKYKYNYKTLVHQ